MKILLTGAAGYLGSVLLKKLIETGHDVTAIDERAMNPEWANFPGLEFIQADVRSPETFQKQIQEAEIIFPFAALVGTPLCDREPERAWQVNVEAIQKLLALKSPEQKLIFPMTNNMYVLSGDQTICDETAPVKALSLYTQSKLAAEELVLKNSNTISLRLASVFGVSTSMRWDVLAHDFTRMALEEGKIELYESGFKRNFLHIEDAAETFLFAAQNFSLMKGNIFNVAGKFCNLTKEDLAREIKKALPSTQVLIKAAGKDPDQRDFFISTEKLAQLGCEAKRTLSETLPFIIEERKKMNAYQSMTAVILAGGEGTRLRSVLGDLPKVLAPVAEKPFITFLLDQLIEAGFDRALLCLGFQAETIQQALGNSYKNLTLDYSIEPEALGTAGALRYALSKIQSENVLVLNGDSYVESGIRQIAFEEGIAVVKSENVSRYGNLEWDETGVITRFIEKTEASRGGWINSGVYFLKRKTIERISAFQAVSLEYDIFPSLVREKKLKAFPLSGKFVDIGTPESLTEAETFFAAIESR